jgi:hypothetical protein
VDIAQGVHDALERDASQRPAAERNVESLAGEVERFGVVDGEADTAALLVGESGACRGNALGIRVEGIDLRRAFGRERGQAASTAADIEDALAVERDDVGNRSRLYSVVVASLHGLCLRFVSLERCAAGTELLRLASGVLELGAGVGVDELAGLDSFEAVSF